VRGQIFSLRQHRTFLTLLTSTNFEKLFCVNPLLSNKNRIYFGAGFAGKTIGFSTTEVAQWVQFSHTCYKSSGKAAVTCHSIFSGRKTGKKSVHKQIAARQRFVAGYLAIDPGLVVAKLLCHNLCRFECRLVGGTSIEEQ